MESSQASAVHASPSLHVEFVEQAPPAVQRPQPAVLASLHRAPVFAVHAVVLEAGVHT